MGEYQQYPSISIVFPRQTQQFVERLNEEYQQYPLVSVVIPALNEARNLRHVLPLIEWFVHEIILVDGYSTDDTVTLVEQLRPTIRPPFHIIMQTGKGKGDAPRIGCAASTGDIIVTLDGDGSAYHREIPLFVEAFLRGNDFAKGLRCIRGGGSHDFSRLCRMGNYGLRKLVNLLFRTRFSDLCYGYNAFWKYCLAVTTAGYLLGSTCLRVLWFLIPSLHRSPLKIMDSPPKLILLRHFQMLFRKGGYFAENTGSLVLKLRGILALG